MATRTRAETSASNGRAGARAVARAKRTGGSIARTARDARSPALLTAGATAAGLAGGFALGSRKAWRRSGSARVARALGQLARELGSLTGQVASVAEDGRELRQQLEQLNRRSPVEVLLDGLTHRRGAHKNES